eukprot:m.45681 g.45681  ORF g.45681 m.45681 type:complete len:375 (+) comp6681_c0_seq1:291-1415(+)
MSASGSQVEAAAQSTTTRDGQQVSNSLVGSLPPITEHEVFSDEAMRHTFTMVSRPTDVFIATPPKTGTTWLQQSLHCLRTACAATGTGPPIPPFEDTMFANRADYDAWVSAQRVSVAEWPQRAMDYEDIYQVSPWDQLAWDLGFNLNDEQVCNPRMFKSHLRLGHLRPGAKYIVTVRDPPKAMVSWYTFLRDKGVPPVVACEEHGGVSAFVHDKHFVVNDMAFGASLWEYYAEYMQELTNPNVLVLVYEDMVKDFGAQLKKMAMFLDLRPTEEVLRQVEDMATKAFMSLPEHVPKFDETWSYRRMVEVDRIKTAASFTIPVTRVNLKPHKEVLNEEALQHLSKLWAKTLGSSVPNYAALCDAVRAEHMRRYGMS